LTDVFRGLDRVARDIDHAGLHHLLLSSASSSSGTLELRHSIATCGSRFLSIRGKNILGIAALAAQRLLPIRVGLDAVAVADVHGGRAGEPSAGAPVL